MMILMKNYEKADCKVSILLPLIIPRAHLYTTDMVCALCEAEKAVIISQSIIAQ